MTACPSKTTTNTSDRVIGTQSWAGRETRFRKMVSSGSQGLEGVEGVSRSIRPGEPIPWPRVLKRRTRKRPFLWPAGHHRPVPAQSEARHLATFESSSSTAKNAKIQTVPPVRYPSDVPGGPMSTRPSASTALTPLREEIARCNFSWSSADPIGSEPVTMPSVFIERSMSSPFLRRAATTSSNLLGSAKVTVTRSFFTKRQSPAEPVSAKDVSK